MADEKKRIAANVDEAIAHCLVQQDRGTPITPQFLAETFPDFRAELIEFFENEKAVIGDRVYANTSLTRKNISRFELQSQLGKGSFGEVWRAWDTSLRREVAIKIPRYLGGDPRSEARFMREARAASQLKHRNIVQVLEFGKSKDVPFICTELVEGSTFCEWAAQLRSKDAVGSPFAVARMVSQVADGMAHAHELGIIHRDLNPRNILVDNDSVAKILDFGVAKSELDASTVTLHGEVLGTPAYVSPEQAAGSIHGLDGRSDVFSIGVILYEMLTGERPFRGDLKLLLHQIRFEPAPNPRTRNSNISPDLANVCLKCLEKSPEDRYQTAAKLHEDLERFVDGKEVVAPERSQSTEERRGWLIALSLLAFLAIVIVSTQQFGYFANKGGASMESTEPDNSNDIGTEVSSSNESPALAPAINPVRHAQVMLERRTYYVDQIEDLIERVIKGFGRHRSSNGIVGEGWVRELNEKFIEFEQETNQLNGAFAVDEDWRSSALKLLTQLEELESLKQDRDIGAEAEAFWEKLQLNLRALIKSFEYEEALN